MIIRQFTFVEMRGLRGFLSKSLRKADSPIRDNASGKYDLNHAKIVMGEFRRSNSVVGAYKVQVNVISCSAALSR